MSSESTETTKRVYRKRRRAEQEEATRQRIAEATMNLHEEIGPARTTISAIAERAGVQRATVYRHFPDEDSLFDACGGLFMTLNPLPDLAEWAAIDDPGERLRTALVQTYDRHERTAAMMERLESDRASVPNVDRRLELRDAYFEAAADVLLTGRRSRGTARRVERAAIAHALEFETWRSLVRRQGLSRDQAIAVATAAL